MNKFLHHKRETVFLTTQSFHLYREETENIKLYFFVCCSHKIQLNEEHNSLTVNFSGFLLFKF